MPRSAKSTPAAAKADAPDYAVLNSRLEAAMALLEDPATDLDAAIAAYETASQLIGQLEAYLQSAERRIETIRVNTAANGNEPNNA